MVQAVVDMYQNNFVSIENSECTSVCLKGIIMHTNYCCTLQKQQLVEVSFDRRADKSTSLQLILQMLHNPFMQMLVFLQFTLRSKLQQSYDVWGKFKARKVLCNILDPGIIRTFQHNSTAWRNNSALEILQLWQLGQKLQLAYQFQKTMFQKTMERPVV